MTFRTRKSPVLVALSKKRAQLSREVLDLEKQLEDKLAKIKTLDCTMLMLGIACDMELARPRRVYTRTFRHGELKRLIVGILKDAGSPLTTRQVADEVRRCKRLLQDYRPHVKRALARYRITVKVGQTDNGESLWTLTAYAAKAKADLPPLRLV